MSYAPPTAFLPPHADSPFHGQLPVSPGRALLRVRDLLERHEAEVLPPAALAAGLGEARGELLGMLGRLEERREQVARAATAETSRQATLDRKEHESALVLEQYRVYDAHFRVFRVAGLEVADLAGQVAATFSGLLADLPNAMLSRVVVADLLGGLEGALAMLPEGGEPAVPAEAAPWPWPDDTAAVARFRWLTGHHGFGLLSSLGRESLDRAAGRVDDTDGFAREMGRAGRFLAGTSAAMHYATNFPASLYQGLLRPELEASGMPGGFSGSQNPDYNHMKLAKGRVLARVEQLHGRDPAGWPEPIRSALRDFHQVDRLDIDHHILVAAAMIRSGPSLKQLHEGGADSALEALRRVGETRRREFPVG